MTRTEILATAEAAVMKDRNATHGEPEDNFGTIARLWNVYCDAANPLASHGKKTSLSGVDVAVMMILVKVARIATSPEHPDHWVDIAGYAACGGEIATKGAE